MEATQNVIEARISEIMEEFSALPELKDWDLTLGSVDDTDTIEVVLKKGECEARRLIKPDEPLDFIADTFYMGDRLTISGCKLLCPDVSRVYFDHAGRIRIEHEGKGFSTVELLKTNPEHRERIAEQLREKFGKKFIG